MDRLQHIRDLLAQDDHAEALRQCEALIQQTGGRGDVALLTAQSLVGLARLQEAETWVQRARVDLQDETEALRLLAQIYRRRGWRVRAQAIERRLAPKSGEMTGLPEGTGAPAPPLVGDVPGSRRSSGIRRVRRGATPGGSPEEATMSWPGGSPPGRPPHSLAHGPPRTSPAPQAPRTPRAVTGVGGPVSADDEAPRSLPKLVNSAFEVPALTMPEQPAASPAQPAAQAPPAHPAAQPAAQAPPAQPAAQPAASDLPPDQGGPDPLGLLSDDQAEDLRRAGPVKEVAPDPTPEPAAAGGGADASGADEREIPAAVPSDQGAGWPTTHGSSSRVSSGAGAGPAPRHTVGSRRRYVDPYTAQRRRSRLMLLLTATLGVTVVVAGIFVYSAWRKEQVRRTLLATQVEIDMVGYEGLKNARQLVRESVGDSEQPDGVICARGAQVELWFWIYYTGDRAYLGQAENLLEDAELRAPDDPETWFTRALWEGYLGDPSVTLETARRLDERGGYPADRVYLLRGIAASAMGDHVASARHFEKAVSVAPTILNHLAFAREAERYGAVADAIDQLEAIQEIDPDHTLAAVDLALLRAGEVTDRGYLDAVEEVLKQYNGLVPPRVMSRVFRAKARGYAARADVREASRWFDRALTEDPDNPDLLLAYAHELRVWGDLRDARAQLARITKHQPNSGDALMELAILAYLQDRPDELAGQLDSFATGARGGAAYELADGLASLIRGDHEQAIDRLVETPQELWGGEARLWLGEAQIAAGRPEEARGSFVDARRLLVQYRGQADPLVSVADVSIALVDAQRRHRPDQARLERALRRHGRYPLVLYTAGRLEEARHNDARAARLYRKAFERGQDFSLALAGYVRTARGDRGSRDLVRAAAEQYLRLAPEGGHAAMMRDVTAP